MAIQHFLVRRDNLRQSQFLTDDEAPALQDGQVLLHISQFALTANNITYAAFGDAMAYWAFFPAPSGWGRIPVWGYADVAQSRHPELREGERVFGYLPMSTHLVVQPGKTGIVRFADMSPHRLKLPAVYQSYTRTAGDSYYDARYEHQQCLFRPLFATAFLLDDFLADHQGFGARRVVLTSASSKTSLGLAWLLSQRPEFEVVGLTGEHNRAFCEQTGYYQRVLSYAQLGELSADTPTALVDMAGNGKVLHDVHHHFGVQLKYSCMVGGTHWEQRQVQHALPGAKPAFFFAPTQMLKRNQDWTPAGLESRIAESLQQFIGTANWLRIEKTGGPAAVERCYRQVLEGQSAPAQGHILSLESA